MADTNTAQMTVTSHTRLPNGAPVYWGVQRTLPAEGNPTARPPSEPLGREKSFEVC